MVERCPQPPCAKNKCNLPIDDEELTSQLDSFGQDNFLASSRQKVTGGYKLGRIYLLEIFSTEHQ
jgi:hypothetical protein